MVRASRILCAALVIGFVGVSGLACPAKEERIEVSREGALQLQNACDAVCALPQGSMPVDPDKECTKRAGCSWDSVEQVCRRKDPCALEGHPAPDLRQEVQVRMVLVDPSREKIRAKSACTPLLRCDQDERPARTVCLAAGINQALDGAMPSGLTYEDLEDPSAVLPVLAVFQPSGSGADAGTSSQCDVGDLVACAGLARPLSGDGPFDITCAACQNGALNPPGVDTGPCPRQMVGTKVTSCFLEGCAKLLAALAE